MTKTSTYELGDDLDLIAPEEGIGANAFSMWVLSGTAEAGFALSLDSGEHDPHARPSKKQQKRQDPGDESDEDAGQPQRDKASQDRPKAKKKKKPSLDEYPDLVEIDDLAAILAAPPKQDGTSETGRGATAGSAPQEAVKAPDLVGIDFGTDEDAEEEPEEEEFDWHSYYYGKEEEEAELEAQESMLDDGYSGTEDSDSLDEFFDDEGGRRRRSVSRPSAQSKVRTVLKTPLASDFDEDDDYDDDEDEGGYVSLFELTVNDRPFAVRALGHERARKMPTSLQRFLDGNVNLGMQVSALWKGFPEAYGISSGMQRYSGFAMRPTRSILTGRDFGEVSHMSLARMKSFDQFVQALADGDPYAIEFFGIGNDNLLYADSSAKALLAYADAFMSKRIGQAALATVIDLIRLIGRPADYDIQFGQDRRDRAIQAIDAAKEDFTEAYGRFARIYVDVQTYDGKPTVMASMNLRDMPIAEMSDFSSTLGDIARGYGMMAEVKGRSHLSKVELPYMMAEVIRILQTTSELLDGEGLHIHRDRKVHVLDGIMKGRLIGPDDKPMREFWEIVDEEQLRLEDAIDRTDMPDEPDERMIEKLVASQNRRVILQDA